jgi:hypothetical protein
MHGRTTIKKKVMSVYYFTGLDAEGWGSQNF